MDAGTRKRWSSRLISGVVVAAAMIPLARPALSQGPPPQLLIVRAEANVTDEILLIEGENFVWSKDRDVMVMLGATPLAVLSLSETHVLAQLPADVEPGAYLLRVWRGDGSVKSDSFALTIGTVGPEGPPGPQGPEGPVGDTGPEGLPGPAGPQGETGPEGPQGPEGSQGPKGLHWRGAWDALNEYATDDAVHHEGSSWVALVPSTGIAPVEGNEWGLLAEQGAPGPQGPQGDQGVPGEDGAPGAVGPKGDRGDPGPPGPPGGLADLGCQEGQIVRWNGTGWQCSEEGADLIPEPLIGCIESAAAGPERGAQAIIDPGSQCTSASVSVPDFSPTPAPWTVGGGRLFNEIVTRDEGSAAEVRVEPVSLTGPITVESSPHQSQRGLERYFSVDFGGTSSNVAQVEVTPFRVSSAIDARGRLGPAGTSDVRVTIRRVASTPLELLAWWEAFIGSPDASNHRTITLRLLAPDLQSDLREWQFDDCAPVAWWQAPQREILTARCRWASVTMPPLINDPTFLVPWLSEALGKGTNHDVHVAEIDSDGNTVGTRVFSEAFVSGYVFPNFDSTSPDLAIETLFIQPNGMAFSP